MGNRILSSMLLAALLSSCGNLDMSNDSSPVAKEKPTVDVIETKKITKTRASCDYKFSEGGESPLSLPKAKIKASRFLKTYDASLIEAVQGSSGSETARFAGLAGVTFYKVADLDIDEKDCLFTASLPDAPSSVLKYFRDAEDEVKGEDGGKSTLLGFYLDKARVEEISGTKEIGPVITVKNDSERYTMIHEFFHHVFALSKDISGTQLQINLQKSNEHLMNVVGKYQESQSLENLNELTQTFSNFNQDFIKVLREYTLEEMTIEFELNDLYQRSALKYVNYYSRLNGDFYTLSSAVAAKERIQKNEKILEALESESKKIALTGSDVSAVSKSISETRKLLVSLKNEINSVAYLAQNRIDIYKSTHKNVAMNQDFLSKKVSKNKAHDCQHSHGVEGVLDRIQSRIGKIKLNVN